MGNNSFFIGKTVHHAALGEGTITQKSDTGIYVNFSHKKDMEFSFPMCFVKELTLTDGQAASLAAKSVEVYVRNNPVEAGEPTKQIDDSAASWQVCPGRPVSRERSAVFASRPLASVDEFCSAYMKQLQAEIVYLRDTGGKRTRIHSGKLIENRQGQHLYSFEIDTELSIPDGTQIAVWTGNTSVDGNVFSCEDFTITLLAQHDLGADLSSVEISTEPWMLLNSLIDRLEDLKQKSRSVLVHDLVCNSQYYMENAISKGQDNACRIAMCQPITFIWGPPGTGKTETLAKIALDCIRHKKRVLMLSYSNVSVDCAMQRLYDKMEKCLPGQIVRYGYAKAESLLQHEYLTSYNLAIHKHPELDEERTELVKEKASFSVKQRASKRYADIQERLTRIRKLLSEEEKQAAGNAMFVATTVSKAVVDKAIYSSAFDTVIFDEASMAYVPQIVFSAGLAKNHFICMGDYNQLSPIVQSSSQSLLNFDIYQYTGISNAIENGKGHKWLCLLDTQHRMHSQIAELVSWSLYGGLLKSEKSTDDTLAPICDSSPFACSPLGVADLSGMMSVCTKTSDGSRVNPLSALISFGLAAKAAENRDVGIITPYNAQSRLLSAMAHDAAESGLLGHAIACATVHQFQGSEKDVIIYDAVDCYRQKYPGTLLTSNKNNAANRLFNVAVTRSKGKFIIVANAGYFKKKLSSSQTSGLLFAKMLRYADRLKRVADGSALKDEVSDANEKLLMWKNGAVGSEYFIQDIKGAKSEIRIDIPGKIKNNAGFLNRLSAALEEARQKGIRVYLRAAETSILPEGLRCFSIRNPYVANPIVIIDKCIVWFGQPESETDFISEKTTLETRYRPIIRFAGKHTALSLLGFLEMANTIDQPDPERTLAGAHITFAQYVLSNIKCKKCGKPMKLSNNKGGFFLGCTAYPQCKNPEPIRVETVNAYLQSDRGSAPYCPQDGAALSAKNGRYGIYVQCEGPEHHTYGLTEI